MAQIIDSNLNDPCKIIGNIRENDKLIYDFKGPLPDRKDWLHDIWMNNGPDKMKNIININDLNGIFSANKIKSFPKYYKDIYFWIAKLKTEESELLYKYLSCFIEDPMKQITEAPQIDQITEESQIDKIGGDRCPKQIRQTTGSYDPAKAEIYDPAKAEIYDPAK